jgi:hypothetical protein
MMLGQYKHNKLHDKSFLDEIKPSDIVLLTETHVGYDTIVDIEEFNYYPFCRQKSNNNRHFGGLALLINKRIRQGVSILQNGNSEYQWKIYHVVCCIHLPCANI